MIPEAFFTNHSPSPASLSNLVKTPIMNLIALKSIMKPILLLNIGIHQMKSGDWYNLSDETSMLSH